MTSPTPLSPAAQAVLDAAENHSKFSYKLLAAAALRAAADNFRTEMNSAPPGAFLEGALAVITALDEIAEDLMDIQSDQTLVQRKDIKQLLRNPEHKSELIEGAVDFICKVEGIRDDH